MKLADKQDIPTLEGWVTIQDAANILGYSRQYAYRQATEGKFKTLHRISNIDIFVVQEKEVKDMAFSRALGKTSRVEVDTSHHPQ